MLRTFTLVLLLSALCCMPANAVTFEWANVGDPGNDDDTHGNGFGGVDYSYRISKHEVTNAQYVDFLNAVAATDANGLYDTTMGANSAGGITRSGTSGSYAYSVKADAIGQGPGGADDDDYAYSNKPVNYVSFFNAMRFVNWLENGQPSGAQGSSTTEDGVYTIGNGVNEVRASNATYFIPSGDEWYKAAYYDPSENGVYYDYPTSSDTTPNNNLPSGDTGNSANAFVSDYTTGDSSYPLLDVGAYSLSESPNGTYDQGGNLWEWTEEIRFSNRRGVRGGRWSDLIGKLAAGNSESAGPGTEFSSIGFRVASVPEAASADFDNDGTVDGFDFLKWQRGESPNPLSADDLTLWETQYGTSGAPLSSAATVPEPSTLMLASFAGLFLGYRRRLVLR